MAVDKKSFMLYTDQKELFTELPDEIAGKLIKLIFGYVSDENPTIDDLLLKIAFTPIKLQLKRDLKKWDNIKDKRSLAGKKSAELRQQNSTKPTSVDCVQQTSTNPTVNVNVNDNVNVNVIKKSIEERKADFKKSFTPFLEVYNRIDLNEFFLYWTEHGLKDKKMRFEKEKSFGIERRLITWMKNKEKFSVKDQKEKKQTGAEAFKNLVYGSATNL